MIVVNFSGLASSLRVNGHGHVFGFAEALLAISAHAGICDPIINSFFTMWEHMRNHELLQCAFVAGSHVLVDLITFTFSVRKWRCSKKMNALNARASSWLNAPETGIIQWLAGAMDHYTLNVYTLHHNVDKPPPSHRSKARNYVRVHPDAVWDMLDASTKTSSTLAQVIDVGSRLGAAGAGCSTRSGARWETV